MPAENANTEAIGITAARMMEKIEADYPNGVKVGDAIIVVEVEVPVPPDDFDWDSLPDDHDLHEVARDWDKSSLIDYYSTSDRDFVQVGLLDMGIDAVKAGYAGIFGLSVDDEEDGE